jgi:hypothetical protein
MAVRGEKLGGDLQITQPTCWDVVGSPFFLREMDPFDFVDDFVKGSHVWGLYREAYECYTWTGTRSVCVMCIRFPVQGVHQFKSPRLSDMSNRLSCGSQHIRGLFTCISTLDWLSSGWQV